MAVPCSTTSRSIAVMIRRGAGADHVLHVGEVFFQGAAFVVRHFGDVARSDVHTVTGKNTVRGRLLHGRDLDRAQSDRQVERDVGRDAEAMSVVDDSLDTDAVGQLQRGDVAGLGQRTSKCDRTLKLFVVIVGLVCRA